MALAVEDSQGGGEIVADKAGFGVCRQLLAVERPARGAAVGWGAILPAYERVWPQIYLLAHTVGRRSGGEFPSTESANQGRRIEHMRLVQLLGGKDASEMRLMTELAANAAFAFTSRRWRLKDVG